MDIIIISLGVTLFLLAFVLFYIIQEKKIKVKREAWEAKIYKQVVYDLENVCKSIYIKYCVDSIIGEHEILGTVKL